MMGRWRWRDIGWWVGIALVVVGWLVLLWRAIA